MGNLNITDKLFKGSVEWSDTETLTFSGVFIFTFNFAEIKYELPAVSKQHEFYISIVVGVASKIAFRISAEEMKQLKIKLSLGMEATYTCSGKYL